MAVIGTAILYPDELKEAAERSGWHYKHLITTRCVEAGLPFDMEFFEKYPGGFLPSRWSDEIKIAVAIAGGTQWTTHRDEPSGILIVTWS